MTKLGRDYQDIKIDLNFPPFNAILMTFSKLRVGIWVLYYNDINFITHSALQANQETEQRSLSTTDRPLATNQHL